MSYSKFCFVLAKVKSYLKDRQWNDATNLAKRRYELDSSLHFAPALVQYYVTLIQNEVPRKAEEVKKELIGVLSGVSKTAVAVEKYANSLKVSQRPYEALLFYQLAIHYCSNERNVSNVVTCLLRCCIGTSIIVQEAIEKGELDKELVGDHVIPFMKKAKAGIERHLPFNPEEISQVVAACLHSIEQCQKNIDDLDGREASLKEAISLLRNNLREDVQKKKIFGTCLNNLGHTYMSKHRIKEAIPLFQQAMEATMTADDFDSLEEKRAEIELTKKNHAAAIGAVTSRVCTIL